MSKIESTDIKVYLSSTGGGASTPADSIGGPISDTELVDNDLHNLFARVDAAEGLAGSTKYRGIYIKNEHGSLTLDDAIAFIQAQTDSTDTSIEVAVADEAIDASMERLTNETTAPAAITGSWVSATGEAAGSAIGDLDADSYRGIWIKRIVTGPAAAYGNDSCQIGVIGETTST